MSEQTYIDVDALLEELRNLPPPTETYAFYTEPEPGIAFLNDQLYEIFNGFLSQFLTPDITTFVSTCDNLIPLLDLALLTAKNRQLVLDILELADVMFDKFVSVSLALQQRLDPQYIVPAHSAVRSRLIDIINQCLESPCDLGDTRSGLQTLKSKIQERDNQAKAASFTCDTQWIHDLWESCPEFKALDSWLTEDIDIPAAALEIVAQGCMSTELTEALPTTTAQLRRHSSQSFSALPTTAPCPTNGIYKRGASLSRTQSLSAMLPPQARASVLAALGTVTEAEEEEA